jgi:hypothetical protein
VAAEGGRRNGAIGETEAFVIADEVPAAIEENAFPLIGDSLLDYALQELARDACSPRARMDDEGEHD